MLFWNAVKAYNKIYFKLALDELKLASPKATKDFLAKNLKTF